MTPPDSPGVTALLPFCSSSKSFYFPGNSFPPDISKYLITFTSTVWYAGASICPISHLYKCVLVWIGNVCISPRDSLKGWGRSQGQPLSTGLQEVPWNDLISETGVVYFDTLSSTERVNKKMVKSRFKKNMSPNDWTDVMGHLVPM